MEQTAADALMGLAGIPVAGFGETGLAIANMAPRWHYASADMDQISAELALRSAIAVLLPLPFQSSTLPEQTRHE